MKLTQRLALVLTAASIASAALAIPARAADKVKFGLLRVPQALFVGIEKGYFAEKGIEVEPVFFRSGAELVPSLSTGQIDLAATSPGAALYNALGAGVKAKIVADYYVPGPDQPGGDPNAVTVRQDLLDSGKVKGPADVKGMTMAITARGQITDLFGAMFLHKGGLTEKDVRVVTMPYPDMLAALQGKAIEVAVAIDPQITIAEEQGIAKRFVKLSDLLPGINLGVVMYGERLAEKERDLGMRFMAAYHKANMYLRQRLPQPGGRDEIGAIFQKYLPIEDVTLYRKIGIGLGNENLSVNVTGTHGLAWQMQQYRDRGLIQTAPDLAKVVDSSFAEAAFKGK
jgi:NitT/TauT family transport system substrate-binding protein